MKKPTPVAKDTVCSVCGLDWKRHGTNPTLEKCVKLLMADLASEKLRFAPLQPIMPQPYPYPLPAVPQPRPWPYRWTSPNSAGGGTVSPPSYTQVWNTGAGNYQ